MQKIEAVSLEDELAKVMSAEIAKEIDNQILFEMYKMHGWQQVVLDSLMNRKRSIDIIEWLEQNCKGKYFQNGRSFVFENDKDALVFILTWK